MGAARVLTDALQASLPTGPWRTRFAPAPTGFLHLGHLVNAIYVWGIARAYGGAVVLRIEDHDRIRCRPEFEVALLNDLAWLGLEADVTAGASTASRTHPLRQSDNDARYATVMAQLAAQHHVYACDCSRREIAASAVSGPVLAEVPYPGTCRGRALELTAVPARRVQLAPATERFDDLLLGPHAQTPATQCGDLLVRDRNGNWTYQFAVTVDDTDQAIDVIIRGQDLLSSVGRQRQLSRLIGRQRLPLLLHHPLVVHPDGAKLSKANRDTAIAERRRDGATPAQLFGEAAYRVGLQATPRPVDVADLPLLFR